MTTRSDLFGPPARCGRAHEGSDRKMKEAAGHQKMASEADKLRRVILCQTGCQLRPGQAGRKSSIFRRLKNERVDARTGRDGTRVEERARFEVAVGADVVP
eukprot:2264936-Pleurochrysis_carterae.AAC.3